MGSDVRETTADRLWRLIRTGVSRLMAVTVLALVLLWLASFVSASCMFLSQPLRDGMGRRNTWLTIWRGEIRIACHWCVPDPFILRRGRDFEWRWAVHSGVVTEAWDPTGVPSTVGPVMGVHVMSTSEQITALGSDGQALAYATGQTWLVLSKWLIFPLAVVMLVGAQGLRYVLRLWLARREFGDVLDNHRPPRELH
jgi:hypothetical protein